MTDPVWSNRFHWCALAAGFLASAEGKIGDSRYVRELAYELFEEGAFRTRVAALDAPAADALESGGGNEHEPNAR